MRINSILVENFRAIKFLELKKLSDAVVIAGPNGCGKSSIFDAIRLVKSAYGQYRNNEYSSWYNEFQIDINKLETHSKRILNDPTKSLKIEINFKLSDSEKEHLQNNAVDLYKQLKWSQITRNPFIKGALEIRDPKTKVADGAIIEREAVELSKNLLSELSENEHIAILTMNPGDSPSVIRSSVLELMFSLYQPQHLGVIDYQSPARNYVREQIGSLNLKIEDASNNKSAQHALYDTQNKYTGVKTEMAQSYIREILAEKAGVPISERSTLKATLDELFTIFFPGKKFLGAIPTKDGGLEFPVKLENGRTHDINELSSGEKEVLLGYLRLRDSAPKNSIILLDEPELHLNPRLAKGLPRFYQKHLGSALNNQIWLVSHSDAILREAVQDPSYTVFHMQPSSQTADGKNQVDYVNASADLENAIMSLVGDLASYNPRSKVVLLEGEGSEFDAKIITELFPKFTEQVNLVSLGSKSKVGYAHDLLEKAAKGGKLDARFFSIVDRDFDGPEIVSSDRKFCWDVYHVENFLLEPKYIKIALHDLSLGKISLNESEIYIELKNCAKNTIEEISRIKMLNQINAKVISAVNLSFDSKLGNVKGFADAVTRTSKNIGKIINEDLTEARIDDLQSEIFRSLRNSLETDDWLKEFRGRNILKRFAGQNKVHYETLRNLIISRMREDQFMPENMKKVTKIILDA